MIISSDNKYIYGINGTSIYQYSINSSTGYLTALSPATVSAPYTINYIYMSPDGSLLFAGLTGTPGFISVYSRNTSTGQLTLLGTSSMPAAFGGSIYQVVAY